MTPLSRLRRRSRKEWSAALVVLSGLVTFVVLVYVGFVVGGGLLLGRTASADVALPVLATAVVALAFDRVQVRLEAFASRVVHGGQSSPYDVLRSFSGTVTGRYAAEELPVRMARLLAEGTGAQWSQVWLVVGDRPVLAATWPAQAEPRVDGVGNDPRRDDLPGRKCLEVRHSNDLLGLLVVQEQPHVQLTTVEERLFEGLAAQAGLVLRGASLRQELEQRAVELSARAGELRLSRQRLVDAQDSERRLLERDIHDGAQQHLVALAVNLSLAQTLAERSPARAADLLAHQECAAVEAVETLVRLTRGIYPTTLTEHGLAAALEDAAATSTVPVHVSAVALGRFTPRVEVALYFFCLEALQNIAKHARATTIRVALHRRGDGALMAVVEDDGHGFDARAVKRGAGLTNMEHRLAALGGTLQLESTSSGTRVCATVPADRES